MPWKVVSERPLFADEWLDIRIADVELPDGRHLAHRSIRTPAGAGVLALDSDQRVLLSWRHRFITGARGRARTGAGNLPGPCRFWAGRPSD
jgi:hypothetical protein